MTTKELDFVLEIKRAFNNFEFEHGMIIDKYLVSEGGQETQLIDKLKTNLKEFDEKLEDIKQKQAPDNNT